MVRVAGSRWAIEETLQAVDDAGGVGGRGETEGGDSQEADNAGGVSAV